MVGWIEQFSFFGLLSEAEPEGRRVWRALWLIVGLSLALRVFLASILPLVADEAYAIAVAREYSISFFDHPPVSFWLPEIMGDVTGLSFPLIYRLPFLVAGSATTVVMFLMGRELAGNRAGLWSAVFYSAAPFFILSGGMFVVPDGPLYLASSICVFAVLRLINRPAGRSIWLWVGAGLALAVALASKYQAAWIPVAVLLFMLIDKNARRWFLTPGPWLAAVIGLVGLVPVVWWNAGHGWASFAFHESRAGGGFNPLNFLRTGLVQALMLLPSVALVICAALWRVVRGHSVGAPLFLALVAIGPIAIFNAIYLTSDAPFAHWTMPGWIFLFPLAGAWMTTKPGRFNRRFAIWTSGLVVGVWTLLLLLAFQAATGGLTRPFFDAPPKWDRTSALFDFSDLEGALKKRGLLGGWVFLMAENWIDAGLIDVALGGKWPVQVFNPKARHHFAYLSDAKVTGKGLMVKISLSREAARSQETLLAKARTLDANAEPLAPVILKRGQQDYVAVSVVRFSLR